jgi:hypothetical protein
VRKWRKGKANGALPNRGTESVWAFNRDWIGSR